MTLADSHCHILDPRLIDRAEQIVKNMPNDGLDFIVEASASPAESRESVEFARGHKGVFCTIGVHPHMAGRYGDEFERWAISRMGDKKIVAFGECGLDYHYTPCDKDLQQAVFERQILLAGQLGLPLVVHTRDAFADTMQILVKNKKHIRNGLLFHCFSEGPAEVALAREHFDAYFAFGGAVTYPASAPKSDDAIRAVPPKSDDAIRAVPPERVLLETDAPYLNPAAAGGKKNLNEPKNVRHVAEYIANLLKIPVDKVADTTLENTRRFFRIPNMV